MTGDERLVVAVFVGWLVLLGIFAVVGPRVVRWHRRGVARVRAAERRRAIADRAAAKHARHATPDDAELDRLWEYLLSSNGVTRIPAPRKRRTR